MINQISNKVLYYSKAYHRILRYTGKSRFCHSTGSQAWMGKDPEWRTA